MSLWAWQGGDIEANIALGPNDNIPRRVRIELYAQEVFISSDEARQIATYLISCAEAIERAADNAGS